METASIAPLVLCCTRFTAYLCSGEGPRSCLLTGVCPSPTWGLVIGNIQYAGWLEKQVLIKLVGEAACPSGRILGLEGKGKATE